MPAICDNLERRRRSALSLRPGATSATRRNARPDGSFGPTSSCISRPKAMSTARSTVPATSFRPMWSGLSRCSRPRSAYWRALERRDQASFPLPPRLDRRSLRLARRRRPFHRIDALQTRTRPIRRRRRPPIIWSAPGITPMACRSSCRNCSNNYGPYHFPEKLIPLVTLNALEGKPMPGLWQRATTCATGSMSRTMRARCRSSPNGPSPAESYNVGGDARTDQSRRCSLRSARSFDELARPAHSRASGSSVSSKIVRATICAMRSMRRGCGPSWAGPGREIFDSGLRATVRGISTTRRGGSASRTGVYRGRAAGASSRERAGPSSFGAAGQLGRESDAVRGAFGPASRWLHACGNRYHRPRRCCRCSRAARAARSSSTPPPILPSTKPNPIRTPLLRPMRRPGQILADSGGERTRSDPPCLDRLCVRRHEGGAYAEDDPIAPLGVYGARKARGRGARVRAAARRACDRPDGLGLRRRTARISSKRCCGSRASATNCASSPISTAARRHARPRRSVVRHRRRIRKRRRTLGHVSLLRRDRYDDLVRFRPRDRRCGAARVPGARVPSDGDRHRRLSDRRAAARQFGTRLHALRATIRLSSRALAAGPRTSCGHATSS